MIYAIEARETMYEGLHGIVNYAVVDERTIEDACNLAHQMSVDLIYSYGLEPSPEEEEYDEWDDQDYEDAWAEMISYSIWRIPDSMGKSTDELEGEFANNPDEFLEYYHCIAE